MFHAQVPHQQKQVEEAWHNSAADKYLCFLSFATVVKTTDTEFYLRRGVGINICITCNGGCMMHRPLFQIGHFTASAHTLVMLSTLNNLFCYICYTCLGFKMDCPKKISLEVVIFLECCIKFSNTMLLD